MVNDLRLSSLTNDGRSHPCWNTASRRMTRERALDEAGWKAFGEWVEHLRVRAGLQVGEAARQAGVSRVWLQEVWNGGRGTNEGWRLPNPKNEALVRLARALNVSPETMLARAGRGGGPNTHAGAEGGE